MIRLTITLQNICKASFLTRILLIWFLLLVTSFKSVSKNPKGIVVCLSEWALTKSNKLPQTLRASYRLVFRDFHSLGTVIISSILQYMLTSYANFDSPFQYKSVSKELSVAPVCHPLPLPHPLIFQFALPSCCFCHSSYHNLLSLSSLFSFYFSLLGRGGYLSC